jgi:adenine phosphoribosyltransferase
LQRKPEQDHDKVEPALAKDLPAPGAQRPHQGGDKAKTRDDQKLSIQANSLPTARFRCNRRSLTFASAPVASPAVTNDSISQLRSAVRDVADFPKPGIIFKDITPVLKDGALFRASVDLFVQRCQGLLVDKIVGIDARGFLFGAAAAYELGVGFVPLRKKGRLPYKTESARYSLEYGEAEMELHVDAIERGEKIVLIDDLLATGGTSASATTLIRKVGGELVEAMFLIELEFLHGRQKLEGAAVTSFLKW